MPVTHTAYARPPRPKQLPRSRGDKSAAKPSTFEARSATVCEGGIYVYALWINARSSIPSGNRESSSEHVA